MPIERLQGLRSAGSAQRFLSIHAAVANTLTTSRHLVSAHGHRFLRGEAFTAWHEAVGIAA